MNFVGIAASLASAATIAGGVLLFLRAVNRRIRLLAVSLLLLSLCQMAAIGSIMAHWSDSPKARPFEILELTAVALALGIVHLLNRENKDRSAVDSCVRVLEPQPTTASLIRLADHTGLVDRRRRADRRKRPRYRAYSKAMIKTPGKVSKPVACEVRDLSQSGMGVMARQSIEVGTFVEIEVGHNRLVANVVRNQPAGTEFSIGLCFPAELSGEEVAVLLGKSYQPRDTAMA